MLFFAYIFVNKQFGKLIFWQCMSTLVYISNFEKKIIPLNFSILSCQLMLPFVEAKIRFFLEKNFGHNPSPSPRISSFRIIRVKKVNLRFHLKINTNLVSVFMKTSLVISYYLSIRLNLDSMNSNLVSESVPSVRVLSRNLLLAKKASNFQKKLKF